MELAATAECLGGQQKSPGVIMQWTVTHWRQKNMFMMQWRIMDWEHYLLFLVNLLSHHVAIAFKRKWDKFLFIVFFCDGKALLK